MQIAEVRQFFQNSRKQYEEQAQKIQATKPEADTTTMLLFGSVKAPSKSEILASFPSRYITDMLIARFFNNRDHGPGTCMYTLNASWLYVTNENRCSPCSNLSKRCKSFDLSNMLIIILTI